MATDTTRLKLWYLGVNITGVIVLAVIMSYTKAWYGSDWYWAVRLTMIAMPVIAFIVYFVVATWRRNRTLGINWKMIDYKHPNGPPDVLDDVGGPQKPYAMTTPDERPVPHATHDKLDAKGMWDGR